jgi:hypothetical protein
VNVKRNVVGIDFFKVMRIPLISGDPFGTQDTKTSQSVAVVSEHMARTFFGDTDPIDHTYNIGSPDELEQERMSRIAEWSKSSKSGEPPEIRDFAHWFEFEKRSQGTVHRPGHPLPPTGVQLPCRCCYGRPAEPHSSASPKLARSSVSCSRPEVALPLPGLRWNRVSGRPRSPSHSIR